MLRRVNKKSKKINRLVIAFIIFMCCVESHAQETDIPQPIMVADSIQPASPLEDTGTVEDLVLEVDGLMIDETRTKAGRDFYSLLYNMWEPPAGASNYMIKIIEKPFRTNSTQIEVWVNDEVLGSTMLQPRSDIIEELAVSVNQALHEYLANYKQMSEQLQNEDQMGSGIY